MSENNGNVKIQLIDCEACGEKMSEFAPSCGHCNHPRKISFNVEEAHSLQKTKVLEEVRLQRDHRIMVWATAGAFIGGVIGLTGMLGFGSIVFNNELAPAKSELEKIIGRGEAVVSITKDKLLKLDDSLNELDKRRHDIEKRLEQIETHTVMVRADIDGIQSRDIKSNEFNKDIIHITSDYYTKFARRLIEELNLLGFQTRFYIKTSEPRAINIYKSKYTKDKTTDKTTDIIVQKIKDIWPEYYNEDIEDQTKEAPYIPGAVELELYNVAELEPHMFLISLPTFTSPPTSEYYYDRSFGSGSALPRAPQISTGDGGRGGLD